MGACTVIHAECPRCGRDQTTSTKLGGYGHVSFEEASDEEAKDVAGTLKCFGCGALMYLDAQSRAIKIAALSDGKLPAPEDKSYYMIGRGAFGPMATPGHGTGDDE